MAAPLLAEYIEAARTGDPVALDQLLHHWYPDLRRYAQRHCPASDAEDALQETFITITRHIKSLRQVGSFSAWAMIILKRYCYALFQKVGLNVHATEADWAEFIDSKPPQELRLDLVTALESLPAHYLQIILMRDFEELTLAEMSEALNENIPAIKSRLHRARTLVREYLQTA